MTSKLDALKAKLNTLADLSAATAVLSWDLQVFMPPLGAAGRAHQLSTLSRLTHELFTSDEMGTLLMEAAREVGAADGDNSVDGHLVRVTQRDYDKATKLPAAHVAERTRVTTLAQEQWARARAENSYARFRPWLAQVIELTQQTAAYIGYTDTPYDALLDGYEPGMTTQALTAIFDDLKRELVPVVQTIIAHKEAVPADTLNGHYPQKLQAQFGTQVAKDIGFDFKAGRLDVSTHPFSTGFGTRDVRITTRYDESNIASALFGILHEAGHGVYEQGFDPTFERTPLSGAISLGIHESQSRLWENILGRSLPFWQHYYPQLQTLYPAQLKNLSLPTFYRAINRVTPSFIRVDADEVTYNLHIMVRFEIEQALLTNNISLDELPTIWNDKMARYLGIRPSTDTEGVLQDIHWSLGLIGYFPTYTLGNIISAQLYEKMLSDTPDFPQKVAQGDFTAMLTWMREHVHRHGRIYTPQDLVFNAVGTTINVKPYMRYIRQKYGNIYGLDWGTAH